MCYSLVESILLIKMKIISFVCLIVAVVVHGEDVELRKYIVVFNRYIFFKIKSTLINVFKCFFLILYYYWCVIPMDICDGENIEFIITSYILSDIKIQTV